MRKYRVLVAEDDKAIRESLGIYLRNGNYDVFFAENGLEAVGVFQREEIDLVIMDLMMPVMDGSEAIIKIREKSFVPIIILSAKSEDYDKVVGLGIGADDYITKPFNPMELMARVNSSLRRFYNYKPNMQSDRVIRVAGLTLDTLEKTIEVDGKTLSLTPIEYGILELLMKHPNQVFTSDEIYDYVWNEEAIDSKTVSVHIRRIREKIEINPNKPQYLQVAWGVGYKFVDPDRRT